MDPRAVFLARIQADSGLQRMLLEPTVAAAAVSIARAAGFTVSAAELCAAPAAAGTPLSTGAAHSEGGAPTEGDMIDFDGDGIPDATFHSNRWELNPHEEG